MNNQLTKIENGKIIKKENVTEEQLINKLYQYERLGTVGKIKSKFEELEVNDDIWYSQFAMARADVEYLKIQLDDYKTRYENIKREFDFSVKFREINQGLKEQCRKYKLQLAEKEEQLLCKTWYKEYKKVMEANDEFYNECAKLREQLAEYKRVCTISHIEDLQVENMLLKGKNQDKIIFTIDELIKVKDFVIRNNEPTRKMTAITSFINRQIAELKGKENA